MDIIRIKQKNGKDIAYSSESGLTLICQDGFYFKDLERCGKLLPYEDWRLPCEDRAKDLAGRMTIEEIAGLMLYSPHQMVPPVPGSPFQGLFGGKRYEETDVSADALSDQQKHFVENEHIRHILMVQVQDAATAAKWSNRLQEMAEKLPHGIPVNISSDPRNGANASSGAEFKLSGSDVSKWPEGIGFAACFDPEVVRQFGQDASREYRALGITTALGPQIDLCTEPRWMRFVDTLGEEVGMTKQMTKAYCDGMQTTQGSSDGWGRDSVNTMVKHWPGGGTCEAGRDAHYAFGQYAVYPGQAFEEHLKPFTEAAFCLDGPTQKASAVMPYYTVSWQVDQIDGQNVGNSYSHYLIHDLLREKYGFDGVVCTDWGITGDPASTIEGFGSRCFGVAELSVAQRHLRCIENGVDQFGGNCQSRPIIEAYQLGVEKYGEQAMRARMEESAVRLLLNIFRCGLFEDPYLNPDESQRIVGCKEFYEHGYLAQQKSVVLLKNQESVLPLKQGSKIYIPNRYMRPSKGFMRNDLPEKYIDPLEQGLPERFGIRVEDPVMADAAIIFVESPSCNPYSVQDLEQGGNGYLPITLQYRPYTAEFAREVSIAGGDFREDFVNRSYKGKTNTAYNEADLDIILDTVQKMQGKPVVVCVTMNNPMVMSEFEREVPAILVEFGVSREAALDVIFGEFNPSGRLPIQLPKDMKTVELQDEDRALDLEVHVDSMGHAYDYGFGLRYTK